MTLQVIHSAEMDCSTVTGFVPLSAGSPIRRLSQLSYLPTLLQGADPDLISNQGNAHIDDPWRAGGPLCVCYHGGGLLGSGVRNMPGVWIDALCYRSYLAGPVAVS